MKRILFRWLAICLFIVIALTGFLLVDATLHDYRPPPEESLKAFVQAVTGGTPSDTLTLVSWNIGYAGLGQEMDFFYDGGRRVRPEEAYFHQCLHDILAEIQAMQGVDFILLQEVDRMSKRSYFTDQADSISSVMPGYAAHFAANYRVKYVPVPIGRAMGRVESGLLTLGSADPSASMRISLPGSFGWPKRLFMLDRCLMLNRYTLASGRELALIHLHLSAFDPDGGIRQQELEKLRDVALEEYNRGNYVIVGGDWNMNPPGMGPGSVNTEKAFTIENGIGEAFLPAEWTWAFDPAVPTNRDVSRPYQQGETPTTIIDFFLVSPNIGLLRVEADHLHFRASDHHPVRATVVLR